MVGLDVPDACAPQYGGRNPHRYSLWAVKHRFVQGSDNLYRQVGCPARHVPRRG